MKQSYSVLGLMSGTSLDGLDIAHCEFWRHKTKWNFKINKGVTIAYDAVLHEQLKNAIHLSEEEHQQLHLTYGKWLGAQAKEFLDNEKLTVDFIASHGHTSHHRPSEGLTFQLGDGAELTKTAQISCINDFRTLDVSKNGQGAPLVPIGDALLFSDYDFCLNLGGISNISLEHNNKRIAFDIGLANMPLNYLVAPLGLSYDKDGKLAESGKLIEPLFNSLNKLPYYQKKHPKSTGIEWFKSDVIPLLENYKTNKVENVLHTIVQHNNYQIANAIKQFDTSRPTRLLITGGGALNAFAMKNLKTHLPNTVEIVLPDKTLIDFKEAMVFAFMGVLRQQGAINILASVTGADSDSCAGKTHTFK